MKKSNAEIEIEVLKETVKALEARVLRDAETIEELEAKAAEQEEAPADDQ